MKLHHSSPHTEVVATSYQFLSKVSSELVSWTRLTYPTWKQCWKEEKLRLLSQWTKISPFNCAIQRMRVKISTRETRIRFRPGSGCATKMTNFHLKQQGKIHTRLIKMNWTDFLMFFFILSCSFSLVKWFLQTLFTSFSLHFFSSSFINRIVFYSIQ